MTYTYQINSSIDLAGIIDTLKEELKLKEGQINYFSFDEDDNIKETLPIDELKDKAMEIFFGQDDISLIFPNVEVNVGEDCMEIISDVKLVLKGIDVDKVISDEPEIKLNLTKLKFDDIIK